MCGIVAAVELLSEYNSNNDLSQITEGILQKLKYRGPDDDSLWCSCKEDVDFSLPKICLGHARLSIVDENAYYPIIWTLGTKTMAIIANGEIYNHTDLRKDLITDETNSCSAESFSTNCDSEVLLACVMVSSIFIHPFIRFFL